MLRFILIVLFFQCFCYSIAQPSLITFTNEQNSDKSISIYAESQAYADYTVKLLFTTLTGYKSYALTNNTAVVTASRGKREILKLTREPFGNSFSYYYKYYYYAGLALRKAPAENSVTYLLPGTPESVIRITGVSNIKDQLNQKSQEEFHVYGFRYEKNGDTICAARAGTVYICSDEVKVAEKGTDVFRSNRNRIMIEHRDGTIAQYSIRNPTQLLVKPGDIVLPGDPLAIFNQENERYEIFFSVTYLDEKRLLADINEASANQSKYVSLPTLFAVNEEGQTSDLSVISQTFKVFHPKKVIGAELSKKEKKKLGLQ